MKITLKVQLLDSKKNIDRVVEIEANTTIRDLLKVQGIDNLDSLNILVNGKKKGPDYRLTCRDKVVVFSPLTGG